MVSSDPFDITFGSEEFHRICEEMNLLQPDANARPSFDGMSGGFKFPDEIPKTISAVDSPLKYPLISVLRFLWGYRVSLVRGEPRSDLKQWWVTIKELAPTWPGFLPDRCSSVMLSISIDCHKKSRQLSKDLDELDKKCDSSTP